MKTQTQPFSQVYRELGDRGRPPQLSESMVEAAKAAAVSAREGAATRAQALAAPAPAPAPVPVPRSTAPPAAARTPTPAAAAAVPPAPPASPAAAVPAAAAAAAAAAPSNGVSGSELLQFVKHQQEREDAIRQAAEDKLERLRQEQGAALEKVRQELRDSDVRDLKQATAADVITAARLEALQVRIEQLQASKLLSRDVAELIEDCIADVVELLGLQPSASVSHPVAEKVLRMVSLSELITADAALSRQLARKLK